MSNLVWFRNDLRTQDNNSLFQACQNSGRTIAVYCFDPRQFEETKYGFKKTEKFRAKFLVETIKDLRINLEKLHISLFIFLEKPETAIPKLVTLHNIKDIFTQREWTSEEDCVTDAVKKATQGCSFTETYDQFLFHPHDIPFESFGQIPETFTEFRLKCEQRSKINNTLNIDALPRENLVSTFQTLPEMEDLGFQWFTTHENTAFPFSGGESQAAKRLNNYFYETRRLSQYKTTRNGLIGENYSSKLSPWLANGSISARTIYWEIQNYEKEVCKNEDSYWMVFELIWRDYFKYISLKHGTKIFYVNGISTKKYDWKTDSKAFQELSLGRTNEPFVNANMIELLKTGFMSNRGRQNVASFWAKERRQDWRIAAAYFESMLIDYDVHSNYGNWIYCAGVGNDPRNRKFNIKRQAQMYDADGAFQKLWLHSEDL